MIAEFGHWCLIGAMVAAIFQFCAPAWGLYSNDSTLTNTAPYFTYASFTLCTLSLVTLAYAYLVSDFSLINVWENSHTLQPLLYKVTGTWGNHEGSMLLWVFILTLFAALVCWFGKSLPNDVRILVIVVQGLVAAAFFAFIVVTSNPFLVHAPVPLEGKDLNPILQDIGLAIHPPLLYIGYVGFSVCFSFACAALVTGRVDKEWASAVRPWVTIAWMFLTLGIAMGSYWAYYELGWGGWWFWDPVENASFMPWLIATALLHSVIIMQKREALKIWSLLLAILTFSLSLLGTFLVRSGVLTSVHTFAQDPARGLFILAILLAFIGGSLLLFALRAHRITRGEAFYPISREGALIINNLILCTATSTVLIGTLYPLVLEVINGQKISVGPPYFNITFGALMFPLFLLLPLGTQLTWKRADFAAAMQRLFVAALVAFAIIIVAMVLIDRKSGFALAGLTVATWVIAGAVTEVFAKTGLGKVALSARWQRLKGLPVKAFASPCAHFGVGVTILGVVSVTAFETEIVTRLKPGQSITVAEAQVTFRSARRVPDANFIADQFFFDVAIGEPPQITSLVSEKRIYPARRAPTTEAGLLLNGFSHYYVSVGDVRSDLSIVVRLWHKPYVTLIWIGALFMSLGGLLSVVSMFRQTHPVAIQQEKMAGIAP